MKYGFILNELKQALNLKPKSKTVSTLRVPIWLDSAVKKGIVRHGNLAKYLETLLRKYRFLFYTGGFKPSENAKTEYQKRGEDYVLRKFRPENKDWLELKMWAEALGISATFMFVKLVEIEELWEPIVNERVFLKFSYVLTTPYYGRIPQLRKALRKGRSIYERGITFYDPPKI
ncbi:MAG: DUF1564 domain-containing protein [Leptospiraceae bacterium]|nr:DUF1564 domain-containing protein [Leptospiraceae bacterium]